MTDATPREKTFTAYTQKQGQAYAQARGGYHSDLYNLIVKHHTSTGGELDTLLDVGCGPGPATSGLATFFAHSTGIDPSEGMIAVARSVPSLTRTGEPVRFEVSTAEDLGAGLTPPVVEGTVDLITAATAAHWFDMPRFWARAARVLKPGGTVALWTVGEMAIHPSVPNADAIQAAVDHFNEVDLAPFMEPGNLLARRLYQDMPLPWTLAEPLAEFDKGAFFRKEWNQGAPEEKGETGEFYLSDSQQVYTLDLMEKVLATISPVTRWREAHPDAVGTEEDVVRKLRRNIERLWAEVGIEPEKQVLRGDSTAVLIMVKKKA